MTLSGRRRVVLSRLFYSGRARLRVRVLILLEIPRSVPTISGRSSDQAIDTLDEHHRRSIGSLGIERRPLTPQVFDRRHRQQQVLGGFLRSLAAREGERHLELPLAQAAQRIRRQVGRGSTARFELAAGLDEPGLRSKLGEAGERALEMFDGLGGSANFPEPTAVG